ncbi:MAG: hypothetical protein R2912_04700 [Eubacteriales bacterium]
MPDISRLGGISGKGLTGLNGSAGNKGMRVYETPSGMLNSIGIGEPACGISLRKRQHTCAHSTSR